MAAVITITNIDNTQNEIIVSGSIALTATYPGATAGSGDPLSFAGFDQIKSSGLPTKVEAYEAPASGVVATGFDFVFCPGTTQANGVLQILTAAAAPGPTVGKVQLTNGTAYSATTPSLAAAVISFRAWFPRL